MLIGSNLFNVPAVEHTLLEYLSDYIAIIG